MKPNKAIHCLTSALLLSVASSTPVAAQNFSMPRFALGGGGGISADTVFSIAGFIGQPVYGEISDSRFTLQGGFWPVPLVSQPCVGIQLEKLGNGQVRVSWPTNCVLWHNLSLPGNWGPFPTPSQPSGTNFSVIRSEPMEFFRLAEPQP